MDICNIDHRHLTEALKERNLQDLDLIEDNGVLSSNLPMAALEIYNNRLKSRMKRKVNRKIKINVHSLTSFPFNIYTLSTLLLSLQRIVREFGLLNRAKVMSLPNRYPLITNGGGKYEEIFRFGRLV